jgi:2-oxoglutarate dehydrogenase E1 component
LALSPIEEFQTNTSFKPVIVKEVGSGSADTVIMCSGKVYLDILSTYPNRNFKLVALEQLAPFPLKTLKEAIGPGVKTLVWVQEEPKNQGCWGYLQALLLPNVTQSLACVSLPPLSGPAVGNSVDFKQMMAKLMKDVEKYLG